MKDLVRPYRLVVLTFFLVLVLAAFVILLQQFPTVFDNKVVRSGSLAGKKENSFWQAPDTASIPKDNQGVLVRYGLRLIERTADYLGPQGNVIQISNGMNCQNCHLDAGTKLFGNNFGSVAATYPIFRPRSGKAESIEKRINDCMERSLNGQTLDSLSREMRAMVAYIQWLGRDIPKGKKAAGSGLVNMDFLPRAANPIAGKKLYLMKCQICHGYSGEGQRLSAGANFIYPPLWGENSFNTGAGLYRISSLARYIRTNMPREATYEKPVLTEEEAWDIAAYVVSLPRPEKVFREDWPRIELKPVDHPFGPYVDSFSEMQHKYGPFPTILNSAKEIK